MGIFYFLADTFINVFGITQPTPKARKQAAFFICGLTILVILGVAAAGVFIQSAMH